MWNTQGFEVQKNFFSAQGGSASGGEMSSHAYLFHGQEKIGKKTFALELAGKIAHVDDTVLAGTDIDAIREVKRFLSLSPLHGEYKVVVIDNAHRMQDEAQNALLKMLEEPSASSKIILVSSQTGVLLETITSRCQEIFFPTHNSSIVRSFLKDKNLNSDQEDFLVAFSNGSIGLLSSMEDYGKIRRFAEEFTFLTKTDIQTRFEVAKKLAVDSDLREKVLFWMLYLRSKKFYKPLAGLLELHRTVAQPQFNEQLALENFMLSL